MTEEERYRIRRLWTSPTTKAQATELLACLGEPVPREWLIGELVAQMEQTIHHFEAQCWNLRGILVPAGLYEEMAYYFRSQRPFEAVSGGASRMMLSSDDLSMAGYLIVPASFVTRAQGLGDTHREISRART